MPMTKAERAEMDRLKQALAETKALRWSGLALPERMPVPSQGHVNGWEFLTYRGEIIKAWSEQVRHSLGSHYPTDGSRPLASQYARALFRTRRDALIGLRLAKEAEFAKELARIDAAIEAEAV